MIITSGTSLASKRLVSGTVVLHVGAKQQQILFEDARAVERLADHLAGILTGIRFDATNEESKPAARVSGTLLREPDVLRRIGLAAERYRTKVAEDV